MLACMPVDGRDSVLFQTVGATSYIFGETNDGAVRASVNASQASISHSMRKSCTSAITIARATRTTEDYLVTGVARKLGSITHKALSNFWACAQS